MALFALPVIIQSCEFFEYIQKLAREDICAALPRVQSDNYFTPISINENEVDVVVYLTTETTEEYSWEETRIVTSDLWTAFDTIGGYMQFMDDVLLSSNITGELYVTQCGDLTTYHFDGFKVVAMKTYRKKLPYFIEIKQVDGTYQCKGTYLKRKSREG